MEKTTLSGVASFFDDYDSTKPPNTRPVEIHKKSKQPKKPAHKSKPSRKPTATQKPKVSVYHEPVKARRGRPAGVKSGAAQHKTKATFYVSAPLLDFYRNWSWDERCNVGELVERALVQYKKMYSSPAE